MRDFNHITLKGYTWKALICTFIFLFMGMGQSMAQRIVKGTVTDETGEPLVGVSVLIKGTGHGAITDTNGNYGITVNNENAVLVFSYLGMESYQTTAKSTRIDVKLHPASNELAEVAVVSTGYQKLSRERSTAAFGLVDSTKLARQMTTSLQAALEGQVAGLVMNINPNNGEMSPILRGVGTFSNDVGTQPLIVIDDMPTELTLSEINPYNVESVTILKDAAAASIYGALAANGVIVITTKEAKNKGVNVTVNADWFISSKPNFDNLNLASTGDIIDYQTAVYQDGVAQSGSGDSWLGSYKSNYYNPLYNLYLNQEKGNISADEVNATLAQWRGNDYYKQFRDNAWQTAVTQRYNIALSQKAGKSNHYASFNFEHDKNRLINDKDSKFSLYYKSSYNMTSWLTAQVGIDTRLSKSNTPEYYDYNFQQRYEQIKDADGNLYTSPFVNKSGYSGSAYNGQVVSEYANNPLFKSFGFNVIDALGESITHNKSLRIRPFVNLQAKFLKHFKYNMMYQYEWAQSRSKLFDSESSYLMRMTHNAMVDTDGKSILPSGGRFYQAEGSSQRHTFRNQLGFDYDWLHKHSVTAIAGLEFRETKSPQIINQVLYGYDPVTLTSDHMNWEDLYTGVGNGMLSNNSITLGGPSTTLKETHHRYASFYMNASYTYQHLYSLSGSLRWDEADLFGLDIKNQHKPLWSIGAGWNISGEKFMQKVSWVDYLKLRATYGVNGNVDQTSTSYFVVSQKTTRYPIKDTYLKYDDDDLPNPRLRWEKTATFNLGLDFRLFNNILNGNIEFYNRKASDLLVRRYMDATLGVGSRVVNNGEMRNRGLEISLTGNIIRTKDWNFSAALNYAHNSNKMQKVDHSEKDVASSFIKSPTNYFVEGTAYNTLWAYHIDRFENGYPIATDKEGNDLVTFNEDGTVNSITRSSDLKGTDDLVNLGSLTPKYNGSLSLNLRWKNLELNTLFVYAGGNKLRLTTFNMNDNSGSETFNGINSRWSESNPNGTRMYLDMPTNVRTYASIFNEWNLYGDHNVKNANYIKLRSINLSYTLPLDITRHVGLGRTKFTLQVNNLFTWCRAGHNIDPEAYSYNNGGRSLSQPKTVSICVTTSF